MDVNNIRNLIEKASPLYPDLRDILNSILDNLETTGNLSEEIDLKFKQELIDIKGIGIKEAEDIVLVYPTKQRLINDIKFGKKLPFHSDVEKLLISKYS